jgi:hypothetical protein
MNPPQRATSGAEPDITPPLTIEANYTPLFAGLAGIASCSGPVWWIVSRGPEIQRMADSYDPGCDNLFGAGSGAGETLAAIFWSIPMASIGAALTSVVITCVVFRQWRRLAMYAKAAVQSVSLGYLIALMVGACCQSMELVALSLGVVSGLLLAFRFAEPYGQARIAH